MKSKEKKTTGIKGLNSICATILLSSIVYILVAGFEIMAVGALAIALVGLATPVVISGEGVLEILLGTFEAIAEGVLAIFEGIANAFSALFG